MKAFLLSAGLGTRLKPLTDHKPKCLLPIWVPLDQYDIYTPRVIQTGHTTPLQQWFRLCGKYGITEILVNVHVHVLAMCSAVNHYAKTHRELKIKAYAEPKLLGTAGTILANRDWIGDDKEFLIVYTDVLTAARLDVLIDQHRAHRSPLTMGLYRVSNPRECGIVTTNSAGRIVHFWEKPPFPEDNLANSGIYVAGRDLLDKIPSSLPCDLARDVIPDLVGHIYGFPIRGYVRDIGTQHSYRKAQKEWRRVRC